jgi:hypothetical protein
MKRWLAILGDATGGRTHNARMGLPVAVITVEERV